MEKSSLTLQRRSDLAAMIFIERFEMENDVKLEIANCCELPLNRFKEMYMLPSEHSRYFIRIP